MTCHHRIVTRREKFHDHLHRCHCLTLLVSESSYLSNYLRVLTYIPSDQIWPVLVKKSNIFMYFIQIFIITFRIDSFWDNTSMSTFNPIFHTFLIGLGRYGLEFLQRISFHGLNRLMARSLKRIFEFWKQEKVTGSQTWRIRWLSNDFCFVFRQTFSHNQAEMWRRIIVVCRRRASYAYKRCWEPLLPLYPGKKKRLIEISLNCVS